MIILVQRFSIIFDFYLTQFIWLKFSPTVIFDLEACSTLLCVIFLATFLFEIMIALILIKQS